MITKNMTKKKNHQLNKGFTLVEVIVSIAILSILSLVILNIFAGGFRNLTMGGQMVQTYQSANSELELAVRDKAYNGESHAQNVLQSQVTVTIFGEDVPVRLIQSKLSNQSSALDPLRDDYLSAYGGIQTANYSSGEAFIAVGRKNELNFKNGDIPLTPEMLNGDYIYNGQGVLVIPSDNAVLGEGMDHVKWKVKDGIVVKSGVELKSLGDFTLMSQTGSITLDDTVISANGAIMIDAKTESNIQGIIMTSRDASIEVKGVNIIANGTDLKPTSLETKALGSTITFSAPSSTGEIFINTYFYVKINGNTSAYVYNKNEATVTTANYINGDKEFR